MEKKSKPFKLAEDWWAVLIAFLLILLAVLGVLGEGGLAVKF
jgi:hypothetical protein